MPAARDRDRERSESPPRRSGASRIAHSSRISPRENLHSITAHTLDELELDRRGCRRRTPYESLHRHGTVLPRNSLRATGPQVTQDPMEGVEQSESSSLSSIATADAFVTTGSDAVPSIGPQTLDEGTVQVYRPGPVPPHGGIPGPSAGSSEPHPIVSIPPYGPHVPPAGRVDAVQAAVTPSDFDEDMADTREVETQILRGEDGDPQNAGQQHATPPTIQPAPVIAGENRDRASTSGTSGPTGTSGFSNGTARPTRRSPLRDDSRGNAKRARVSTIHKERSGTDGDYEDEGEDEGDNTSLVRRRNVARLEKAPQNAPATKGDIIGLYRYHKRLERRFKAAMPPEPEVTYRRLVKQKPPLKHVERRHHTYEELQILKQIRYLTARLLGRTNRDSPFPLTPTAAQIENLRRGIGGPTLDAFSLDLAGFRYQSEWNLAAAEVFAEQYLAQNSRKTDDRELVIDFFIRGLPDLCEQYRDIQTRRLPVDDERYIKMEARDARRVVNSRRNGTTQRRIAVVKYLHVDLEQYITLVDMIGTEGMSDDERVPGPHNPARFNIIGLTWRAKQLTNLLQSLDGLHNYSRFSNDGALSRGSPPRDRRRSSRVDDQRPAPIGLPKNCYDHTWLESLSPIQRSRLRVQDKEINLTLSKNMQEVASFYRRPGSIYAKTGPILDMRPAAVQRAEQA
ncbi:hypothetical protein K474DRAFT_1703167 [Panus rudis PR-1116 ss-1]|nr:hypothetical protein K474DRAFT_1703167 [Panus rudis PR-1116 ss-1]